MKAAAPPAVEPRLLVAACKRAVGRRTVAGAAGERVPPLAGDRILRWWEGAPLRRMPTDLWSERRLLPARAEPRVAAATRAARRAAADPEKSADSIAGEAHRTVMAQVVVRRSREAVLRLPRTD